MSCRGLQRAYALTLTAPIHRFTTPRASANSSTTTRRCLDILFVFLMPDTVDITEVIGAVVVAVLLLFDRFFMLP